jgi:hypothetical protein
VLIEVGDGGVIAVLGRDVWCAGFLTGEIAPFADEAGESVARLVHPVDLERGVSGGESVLAGAQRDLAGAGVDLGLAGGQVDLRAPSSGLDPQQSFLRENDRDVVGVDARRLVAGCRPAMLERDGSPLQEDGVPVVLGLIRVREPVEPEVRLDVDPEGVPVREYHFGARRRAGGDPVSREDGSVQPGGGIVLRSRHEGDLGADVGKVRVPLALGSGCRGR